MASDPISRFLNTMESDSVKVKENFELYDCCICMESLMNKEPRILHCGHTFCTPCLEKLASGDMIRCPKCREQTSLSLHGITSLPKNTDLSKMKEREQMLSISSQTKCQMCLNNSVAEYFCIDCKKLICEDCEILHIDVHVLRGHHLVSMKEEKEKDEKSEQKQQENCMIHGEERNFFCSHCDEAVCVLCLSKHTDHKHHIMDLDSGMKAFKRRLDVCYANCAEYSDLLQICSHSVEKDLNKIVSTKKELGNICDNLEEKLIKMRIKLKAVVGLEESIENINKMLDSQSMLTNKLKKEKMIISTSTTSHQTFVSETKDWHKRAMQQLSEGREMMVYKYKIGEYKPGTLDLDCSLGEVEITEASLKNHLEIELASEKVRKEHTKHVSFSPDVKPKEFSLEKPKLMLEIKPGGEAEMSDVQEVISVGDGSILLVDTKQVYVQRISNEGKLLRKYYISDKKSHVMHIVSTSVYESYLFVASADWITKMPLDGSGDAFVSKPRKVKIVHITASGDNNVLISEPNKIQEYDFQNKKVTTKVPDIDNPGKICIVHANDDPRYIVSRTSGIFKRSVKIYDRNWKSLHSIVGWMWEPRGLTVTPDKKLLVADYYEHKINEYTLDGHYVKYLFHQHHHQHHHHHHHHHFHLFSSNSSSIFKSPRDIAYCSPHMWVLKDNPHTIQMFLVDKLDTD